MTGAYKGDHMKLSILKATFGYTVAVIVATSSAKAADLPSFVHDGVLKVCTAGDFPPMGFAENPGDKELSGYEIDMVDALAKQWDAKTDYVVSEFKGLLPSLESDRCGLVASGMLIKPERLEHYDAIAHFRTSPVLVVAASTSDIKTPEDLSGKIVAVEAGTNYEKDAAALNARLKADGKPEMTVQTYPGASAVIQQILVGRAAATITQDTTAAYRGAQLPGRITIPYTYPDADSYGLYIRKSPGDIKALRTAYDGLKTSGELAKLLKKWNLPANATDVEQPK
ncbi:transporter substrate-binding domain-containing protein [Rhizobium leguminosarum]|nr:transporter substrate-binding domain-containing protein [Rhizobium ruizarguesonis]